MIQLNWVTNFSECPKLVSFMVRELRNSPDYTTSVDLRKGIAAGTKHWNDVLHFTVGRYLQEGFKPGSHTHILYLTDTDRPGEILAFIRGRLTGTVAVVLDILVAHHLKGHGLGKFLMGHLERLFKEAGATEVQLTVSFTNHAGQSFFSRMGYHKTPITLEDPTSQSLAASIWCKPLRKPHWLQAPWNFAPAPLTWRACY